MADRPHRLPPSSDSTPSKKPSTLKERARNALITGTAGGYLGGMLVEGTTRVKIPALTRKLLRLKRKTVGIHGARTGALAGALIGARNRGERSETADAVATGGDWKFQNRIDRREAEGQRGGNWIPNSAPLLLRPFAVKSGVRGFSAFIEDMTFSALSKDVQTEVLRFVDAQKGTPVVHYGMGVKELLAKADAVNLASARKALGTLRASRARDEVLGKIKDGSKYILLMNDRIVDGHHFLAKAERGNVTSSLNVLDLTPARLSTGKVTEFAGKPEEKKNPRSRILDAGALGLAGSITGGVAGAGAGHVAGGGSVKDAPAALKRAFGKAKKWLGAEGGFGPNAKESLTPAQKEGQRIKEALDEAAGEKWKRADHPSKDAFQGGRLTRGELHERAKLQKQFRQTKARRKGAVIGAMALGGAGALYAAHKRPIAVKAHSQEEKGKKVGGGIGAITGAGIGSVAGGVLAHNPLLGAVVGTTAGAHLGRRVGSAIGSRMKASDREISARETAAKKKQLKLSALGKFTQFAEGEPRRNRTRDLRDKIGLAKDVAGLGVTVGAGVGAHKLYKGGKQVLRKVGPQIGAAAKAWHKAALKTGKTLDTVKDAVAPAAGVNRGVASVGRKIVQGARRVAAFLHSDPRPVMEFSDERKAQWNAALLGAAAPVAAGGLVLGTRGGRNALRGLLSKVDKGDPRRLRRVVLNQKRKDASIKRNAAKAVGKAREQFRAEALPKAPKEPGLKDAVKTVRQRAKRKIVNAVANIGANPAETKFEAAPRDKLSKARDAALLTAGVAGTGAVVYGAHKLRGLKSSPTLRKGKAIAENVRNATSITADAGRIYNYLKEPVVRPKRIVAGMRRGWKQGLKEGQSAPAPKWKKGVIKIGKKLRLLEAASPSLRFSKSPRLQSFAIGGLVGSGIGTLIGSQIGERFKYKTRNALKKKLIPKLGQKWGRRVARAGAFIPENAGAAAGGVVGSIAGGGIRRTEMRNAECGMTNFGGKEQLKEIDSGAFPDPLDVFIGRKKGYAANTVKSYHREKNYVKDVRSGKRKGTPQAVAAAESEMKRLRGESVDASHGQVYRSLLKKGDTVRRVSERGGGLIRDAVKHVKGEAREKDAWGRQKKREWEKPWFQRTKNQVAAAAALGGGALLLKKNPRLRAKVDRGVRHVQRKVNSVVPDFFTGVKPLRTKGQKTAASVNAKRQSVAQAKAAKTQASVAAQAQKIAAAAKAVKAPKPKRGNGTPPLKGLARLNGRLIQFSDDPLDVGWDLRDARGRSARVFAPGAGSRDRRPKKWHEKVENERKLWGAAALTGTLAGGVGVRKIMQKTVKTAVQAERSRIGKRVVEVSRKRAAQAAMRQAEVEAKRGNLRVHSEPAAKRVA